MAFGSVSVADHRDVVLRREASIRQLKTADEDARHMFATNWLFDAALTRTFSRLGARRTSPAIVHALVDRLALMTDLLGGGEQTLRRHAVFRTGLRAGVGNQKKSVERPAA